MNMRTVAAALGVCLVACTSAVLVDRAVVTYDLTTAQSVPERTA